MKRIYVLFAALGLTAACAVSCNFTDDYNIDEIEPYADVEINQEPINVPSEDFLSTGDTDTVMPDEQGNLSFSVSAEQAINTKVLLTSGKPFNVPGEVSINNTADVPEFCKNQEEAEFETARIELTLANSASEPILVNASLVIDGTEGEMPEITLPANATDYKVELVANEDSKSSPDAVWYKIEGPLASKLSSFSDKGITIKDITVELFETKAFRAEEEESVFSLAASFVAPLVFKAGSVIKFDVDYSDKLLDVSEYNITVNQYEIYASVTNSFEFEIDVTGSSTNGVSASLASPIKPGSVKNPVTTDVKVNVVSTSEVLNLEGAKLHFVLTAKQRAVIQKDQKLDIDMKSIRFRQK